jgi:hypothetical protein
LYTPTQQTTLLLEKYDSDEDEDDHSKTAASGTELTVVLVKIILQAALKCGRTCHNWERTIRRTNLDRRSDEEIPYLVSRTPQNWQKMLHCSKHHIKKCTCNVVN